MDVKPEVVVRHFGTLTPRKLEPLDLVQCREDPGRQKRHVRVVKEIDRGKSAGQHIHHPHSHEAPVYNMPHMKGAVKRIIAQKRVGA